MGNVVQTFPNKKKVRDGIEVITPPLKSYMIETIKQYVTNQESMPQGFGEPPDNHKCRRAIDTLNKVTEIHGLSDFFTYHGKESYNSITFKFCLTIRKKFGIKSYRGECDDFQRRIELLHHARNRASHNDDDIKDLSDEDARCYGYAMIVLSNFIGEYIVETKQNLNQYLSGLFAINENNIDAIEMENKLKELEKEYRTILQSNIEKDRTIDAQKTAILSITRELKSSDYQHLRDTQRIDEKNKKIDILVAENENLKTENEKLKRMVSKKIGQFEDLCIRAQSGDAQSQYECGITYYYGNDEVEIDDKIAFFWIKQAAEQNHTDAQAMLGMLFYNGCGVEKSYEEAIKWIVPAAEKGIDYAENLLGCSYYYGRGIERSLSKAFEWFTKASEQGHDYALHNIGCMYHEGEYVKRDYDRAKYYFELAAEKGNQSANFFLGDMYNTGIGVEHSPEKAIAYYERAGKKGKQKAEYELFRQEYGDIIDQESVDDIDRLWKTFADEGNMFAQYSYAEYDYWNGLGDFYEDYYRKAAEQGHYEARVVVSLYLYDEKQSKLCFEYIKDIADLGDGRAYYELGKCYEKGMGTDVSTDDAIKWFIKAIQYCKKFSESLYERFDGNRYYEMCDPLYDSEDVCNHLKELLKTNNIFNEDIFEKMCNDPNYEYKCKQQ